MQREKIAYLQRRNQLISDFIKTAMEARDSGMMSSIVGEKNNYHPRISTSSENTVRQ